LDNPTWIELDRQTNNRDLWRANTASFAVWNPVEFRLVRLTQTAKSHRSIDELRVAAVEFFGTLVE
jgi:hypothetical protein